MYNNQIHAGMGNTIGGGIGNDVDSSSQNGPTVCTIGGGAANTIENIGTQGNTISGGVSNSLIFAPGCWIGGGSQNSIMSDPANPDPAGSIGGGANNTLQHSAGSVIGGGQYNYMNDSAGSSIGGGYSNSIGVSFDGWGDTIAGGRQNLIQQNYGTIGGGISNSVLISVSGSVESGGTVAGGVNNTVQSSASFVGGGLVNVIGSNSYDSVITGGADNSIVNGNAYAAIVGGVSNVISFFSPAPGVLVPCTFSFIGGGSNNQIQAGMGDTVGGGVGNDVYESASRLTASTIGGGTVNSITPIDQSGFPPGDTISGGASNVLAGVYSSWIGGGMQNKITAAEAAGDSCIAGGLSNVLVSSTASVVGGGAGNSMNNADSSTIGGGFANSIGTGQISYSGVGDTIAGGQQNVVQQDYGTIGGGTSNRVLLSSSTDSGGTIGGGASNAVVAAYGTIPGGVLNVATNYALAAGLQALGTNSGAFVWADSTGAAFGSASNNTFSVRASGGFRFYDSSSGAAGNGVYLPAEGGSGWVNVSDKNAKKNIKPIDTQAVLEKLARVPVEQWNYKWESDEATPNIGPMAQDFKAAFYPGRDDKGIGTLEFDGVELAAIQGLNQKLENKLQEKEARIQRQEGEIADLKKRLETLERFIAAKKEGGQ